MSNINKKPAFILNEVSEVINLGLNSAAGALSRLIGKTAQFSSITSEYLQISQIEQTGPLLPAVVAQMSCSGAVEGKYALMISRNDVQTILNVLMGSDDDLNPFSSTELDEISLGTIQELLSQMSAAFCQTLTEFFGSTVKASFLEMQLFDNLSAISTVFPYEKTDFSVCSTFRMNIEDTLNSICMYCFSEEFAESVQNLMAKTQGSSHKQSLQSDARMPSHSPSSQIVQPVRGESKQEQANPQINIQPTSFPDFSKQEAHSESPLVGGNINLLMDVPLTVTIEIGKTRKKMREIMDFAQGTIIGLEKQAGAPVDIVVNGQLIARGDVVVIDDNFGVRITEIVGTKDLLEKESQ